MGVFDLDSPFFPEDFGSSSSSSSEIDAKI